jgi:hypothetical protein
MYICDLCQKKKEQEFQQFPLIFIFLQNNAAHIISVLHLFPNNHGQNANTVSTHFIGAHQNPEYAEQQGKVLSK